MYPVKSKLFPKKDIRVFLTQFISSFDSHVNEFIIFSSQENTEYNYNDEASRVASVTWNV